MRTLAKCNGIRCGKTQATENALPHALYFRKNSSTPFVVNETGCIIECFEHRVASNVRPRLMRVPRQQNSFRADKPAVCSAIDPNVEIDVDIFCSIHDQGRLYVAVIVVSTDVDCFSALPSTSIFNSRVIDE